MYKSISIAETNNTVFGNDHSTGANRDRRAPIIIIIIIIYLYIDANVVDDIVSGSNFFGVTYRYTIYIILEDEYFTPDVWIRKILSNAPRVQKRLRDSFGGRYVIYNRLSSSSFREITNIDDRRTLFR